MDLDFSFCFCLDLKTYAHMQTIFFVYFAATQLAHQLHQERTRVLDIHKVAGSAWLEGNPANKEIGQFLTGRLSF